MQNEHLCLELTRSLGLPAARTEIVHFDDDLPVLVVERFDRTWESDGQLLRLHQEDCCQALSVPSSRKYDNEGGPGMVKILELLEGSDDPVGDRRMFLKAQIVFWLIGATDGHAKNFSLLLGPGGRFRLAPFYDVLSAQPAVDARQIQKNQFRLAMAVGDKRHYEMDTIQPRHFAQTARRVGIDERVVREMCEEIIQDAGRGIDSVDKGLPEGFPEDVAESIFGGVRNRVARLERLIDPPCTSEPTSRNRDLADRREGGKARSTGTPSGGRFGFSERLQKSVKPDSGEESLASEGSPSDEVHPSNGLPKPF